MPNYEISVVDLDHWLISLRITSVSELCLGYLRFFGINVRDLEITLK